MLTRRALLSTLPLLAAEKRLNVLFMVADDLNTALGCYHHPVVQSPNIDALARRGTLFDRAYCQFPLCQPSRTSLLSGRRPDSTRVLNLQTPTRQFLGDAVFLPEHFRKSGYFSAHAGKIFHTGEHAEDPRSWDEETRAWGKEPGDETVIRSGKATGPRGHTFRWDALNIPDEKTPDGVIAQQTIEYMEKAQRENKPFFIGAGFRRPHSPYAAPEKYFDLYPKDRISLPPPAAPPAVPAAVNHEPPAQPLSDDTVRDYLRAYYACVTFLDAQVGVIFQAMDRLRLWENTIVVFFGDHGYHLGDHGGLWHKITLFEQAARVPLIVYAPRRKAHGKPSPRLVELVDLYPTLTDLCGLPSPAGLEGSSFAPLLDQPAQPWKQAAFTTVGRALAPGPAPEKIAFLGQSIRTERFRYTEWDDGARGVELYDSTKDPGELTNLAGQPNFAGIQAQLRNQLRRGWRQALPPASRSKPSQ